MHYDFARAIGKRLDRGMKLDLTKPVFVLLGLWNTAIFQPPWMARFLFAYSEGTQLNGEFVADPARSDSPIFYIDNVGISASADRLRVFIKDIEAATMERAEKVAAAIFTALPHTPVGSFGVNFAFAQSDPLPELLERLKAKDDLDVHLEVISQTLTSSLKCDDAILNLTRRPGSASVAFEFNYHFEKSLTAADAAGRLHGMIKRLYERSTKLLKDAYDLDPPSSVVG